MVGVDWCLKGRSGECTCTDSMYGCIDASFKASTKFSCIASSFSLVSSLGDNQASPKTAVRFSN